MIDYSMVEMDGHGNSIALRLSDPDGADLMNRIQDNADLISVPVQVHGSVHQQND
jgi:hypothetical protein